MEIRKIKVVSCLKVSIPVFFFIGIIVAGFSLVFTSALPGQVPGEMAVGFLRGVFAALVYAIFFSVFSAALISASAALYNIISPVTGGVVIDTGKEEAEEDEFL